MLWPRLRAWYAQRSLTQRTRTLEQLLYGSFERTAHHELKTLGRGRAATARQLGLLPRVLTSYERRTALALLLLALTSATLLGWRWYDRHSVVVPAPGGEYAEGIVGTPRSANPLLGASDADRDLAYLAHRGLFRYREGSSVEPDLAESWSVSPDQKTYRITLRPNLRWSDGWELTASDVEFTFTSLRAPELKSPLATSFSGITVRREDEHTVTFSLPEPYAPFLAALTVGIIPAHVWQQYNLADWRTAKENLNPVGTGPFRAKSASYDRQNALKSLTFEPNPFSHTEPPLLTKVTLKFYPDNPSAVTALREGAIDGLGGITRGATATLSELRFRRYELQLPQYSAVFINADQSEPLASRLVRQALGHSINRQQLIQDALGGSATPATNPFVLGEVRSTAARTISYNRERANELLQQAGYSRADDASPYAGTDGNPLTFTLTAASSEEQAAVANALKQQWAVAGIVVNLELVPRDRLQAEVIPQRAYEALLARELIGFDPDPYPFWHSSQAGNAGLNLANFKHHEADKLLESARREGNREQRLAKYAEFQNILMDESSAVFLYSTSYTYAVSRGLTTKLPPNIAGPADRLRHLAEWYRATKRELAW